ncbi:MFS transporter [Streptomyces cavernicola]|uniref:MFS transporter n=1 Tax=Streptomyces cavernicola TaxID=3043613 RepID=A0ABT6S547_9ACTN|nr:MFS transporter [Streptomyces sp. B-S-A6]MDI3403198.1 MFS transporter [Streptomyces sp. B-S-A6]
MSSSNDAVSRPATAEEVPAKVRRKAVVAAAIGNFVEWFEFALYGFFASAIAMNFFPAAAGAPSLIATFAAFGVSFVLRPLGALVFGHYGDRMGRRVTLSLAILGMSVSTFAIGLLPTHAQVGMLAPVLLVVTRVVQGFSAGGEFGGATAYMVEYAPANRRAFYGSWQFFTQFLAGFVAALVGAVLSSTLSGGDLEAWGWRVPFLLTLPLGLIGLYLRLKMDETPEFRREEARRKEGQVRTPDKAPLVAVVREHWTSVLRIVGLLVVGTTAIYMMEAFWPAFLVGQVGIEQSEMFTAMMIAIAVKIVLIPLWALWSDRVGRRKPFLVGSAALLAVSAVPVYQLLLQGEFATTVAGYLLLVFAVSPMTGCLATAMAEAFPAGVRYSALSLAYSIGVSVFGGFSPLILAALVEYTGSELSPAYYLTGTAVVSLLAALLFRETGTRGRVLPSDDAEGSVGDGTAAKSTLVDGAERTA